MKTILKKAGCMVLALSLLSGLTLRAGAEYNDFEAITSHVSTAVPQQLQITRPAKDIGTSAENYYLTGNSDPQQPLTLNGEEVEGRGKSGSFGAYVPLAMGENVFTFQNGAQSATVTINRGSGLQEEVSLIETITYMTPLYDVALTSGSTATLRCTAPAGAAVTANVGGKTIQMKQKAKAREGVPASFTAEYKIPSASGTEELGQVTYTMEFGGNTTSYQSEGSLFAVGKGDTLLVEVKDTSASVFAEESKTSNFVTTAKKGGVDYVSEIGDTMYKLGMGGWIPMESARPLTGGGEYRNRVSDVSFSQDAGSERFVLSGIGAPLFTAYQTGEKLYVKLFHTTGVENIDASGSELFSKVKVTEQNGNTTLEFLRSGAPLWGYLVSYEDGDTVITCKYRPALSGGSQPLSGITVALDAGHGGTDSGAFGISADQGPVEKDITYDTALAVQKRLESLGARVLMMRPEDRKESFNDRMQPAQDALADFYLSLHCNSIATNLNGLKPNGVEIYYYEDISKAFASTILNSVVENTGRASRGAKYSNYKVTLQTLAPSVLVEMGFLTNPAEYDDLCSRRGIFNMANAIGDGLIRYLS